MTEQTWRKSSFSGSQANCIEVGQTRRVVLVRNTKDRTGPVLPIRPGSWRKFIASVRRI